MVKLVDTPALGAGALIGMEVRVLFPAQQKKSRLQVGIFFCCNLDKRREGRIEVAI